MVPVATGDEGSRPRSPTSISSVPSRLLEGDGDPSSASATDHSASMRPCDLTPLRPEDVGKFVSKSTVRSLSLVEITARLYPLQTESESCLAKVRDIESKIYRSSVTDIELASISCRLNSIQTSYNAIIKGLFSTDGMIEYIGAMQEPSAIMPIIDAVQAIALDILISLKSVVEMRGLSQDPLFVASTKHHRETVSVLFESTHAKSRKQVEAAVYAFDSIALDYLQHHAPKLATCLGGSESPGEQVKKIQRELKGIPQPELNTAQVRYVKLLRMGCVILNKLLSKVDLQCNDLLDYRAELFGALLEHAQGVKENSIANLVPLPKVAYLAEGQKKPEHSLWGGVAGWVIKKIDYFDYWGSYPLKGEQGQQLEEVIGEPLGNLVRVLKQRLLDFCQGRFAPKFGLTDILDEYDLHKDGLDALEKAFIPCFEMVCAEPIDGLSKTLRYMYGLERAIKEARGYLQLYRQAISDRGSLVLSAIEGVRSFYSGGMQSARSLYPAALQMKAANKVRPSEKSEDPFDLFLYRTAVFLNEVHAKQDPKVLVSKVIAMSRGEASAGALLLAKAFPGIDDLDALPELVIEYCVTHMMQYLFLPVDEDMELELVLHVIRRDFQSQYMKSYDTVGDFQKVVNAYDDLYAKKRALIAEALDGAVQIVAFQSSAKNSKRNVGAYVEAWQTLFDLKVPSGKEALYKELDKRLKGVATDKKYSYIHPIVQKATIDAFHVEDVPAFQTWIHLAACDITTVIPGALDKEKHLAIFTAVLLRILGASLFAKDPIEMANAHLMKYQLLTIQAYEPYVSAIFNNELQASDMNTLLLQSAITSILTCTNLVFQMLSKREETLVLQAIERYLSKKHVEPEDKGIELVMYKLMQAESELPEAEKTITQKYKASRKPSESIRDLAACGQLMTFPLLNEAIKRQ